MTTARVSHAATLLPSGKVLITGGADGGTIWASAELYDPANSTWSSVAPMNNARAAHISTLLPNGQVLVSGGYDTPNVGTEWLASSELYNPAANTWTVVGSMNGRRRARWPSRGSTGERLPTTRVLSVDIAPSARRTGPFGPSAVQGDFG